MGVNMAFELDGFSDAQLGWLIATGIDINVNDESTAKIIYGISKDKQDNDKEGEDVQPTTPE